MDRQWIHKFLDELLDKERTGLIAEIHLNEKGVRFKVPYRLSIEEYRQWENRLIRPEFYGNAQINVHGGRQHSATIVDSVTQEKFESRQLFDEPSAGQLQSPITA